jgi:predicted RNA-binding protein with PIN domain
MGHGPEMTGDTGDRRPRWLVDGMNLIGSRPDRWWNDPDRAVRRLIGELDRFAAATGDDVTVVFDRRPPDVDPGHHGAVRVAFASRRGRNAADDEIVTMVAGDPEPAAGRVVTSDRRLAERVRDLGAGVEPSSRFRRRIDRVLASDPYR